MELPMNHWRSVRNSFSNWLALGVVAIVIIVASAFIVLAACNTIDCRDVPNSSLFTPSEALPSNVQSSFQEYVSDTRNWVQANRVFLTEDRVFEVDVNSPFELTPSLGEKAKRGILLVHGLGDSPWYFRDIAETLVNQGWLVRVVLLPGHGSRPADLLLPDLMDWTAVVESHSRLLVAEVNEVWLGGYSTGGNLVTSYALQSENISGLLLFSPAFVSRDAAAVFTPVVSWFIDWVDIDEQTGNIFHYEALTANGAALFYKSSKLVQRKLKNKPFDKPVLITTSQDDTVIDPQGVLDLFERYFTHPQSRLIWFGNPPRSQDSRIVVLSSHIPEQRISNFSHMSVLFSPENPYYGRNGSYRMHDNGQEESEEVPADEYLWYSAWGYKEPGKYHVRLTWNPYFPELVELLKVITNH